MRIFRGGKMAMFRHGTVPGGLIILAPGPETDPLKFRISQERKNAPLGMSAERGADVWLEWS